MTKTSRPQPARRTRWPSSQVSSHPTATLLQSKADDVRIPQDMLGEGGFSGFEDDDLLGPEEDEELQADPLYTMDLKVCTRHHAPFQARARTYHCLRCCRYFPHRFNRPIWRPTSSNKPRRPTLPTS